MYTAECSDGSDENPAMCTRLQMECAPGYFRCEVGVHSKKLLSTPVHMHGGLLCIAFCLSVCLSVRHWTKNQTRK